MNMYIADLHCDTLYKLRQERKLGIMRNGLLDGNFHVNLEKLKKGGYLLQNFAAFVDVEEDADRFSACCELIDIFYDEIAKNSKIIEAVRSYSDIERCIKSNKIAAVLTVEEGGCVEGSIKKLKNLYDKGVRMMTLTWNYENELAYPNDVENQRIRSKEDSIAGLKPCGREIAEEMKRLGMIVDISHLSDAGAYELVKDMRLPILASHSNARTICNNVRNLPDDLIKTLADNGGIIGVNLSRNSIGGSGNRYDIIRHIKHITNIGGSECIALGTDFDGIETNEDIKDATQLEKIGEVMKEEGFGIEQREEFFYKNVLRFYRENLK